MSKIKQLLLILCFTTSLFLYGESLESQETLLHYSIQYKDSQDNTSSYIPINATGITLIISATPLNTPVTIKNILITIPQGSAGNDLTNSISNIKPIGPENWTAVLEPKGFVFTPPPGGGTLNDSIYLTLSNIDINATTGSAPIVITEQTQANLSTTLYASKFPETFNLGDFAANPTTVAFGGSTELSWSGSPDATYCIEYASECQCNDKQCPCPVSGSGSYLYNAKNLQDSTTVLTVTARLANADDPSHPLTAQKQLSVTVNNAGPYLSTNTVKTVYGARVRLSWHIPHADPGSPGIISNDQDSSTINIPADQLEKGCGVIYVPSKGTSIKYQLEYKVGGSFMQATSPQIQLLPNSITVGKNPVSVAFTSTPKGVFAYVVNMNDNTFSVIDTSTNKIVGNPIKLEGFPGLIVINSDGTSAYVGNTDNLISIIDIATNKVQSPINIPHAWCIALTPQQDYAFVTQNKLATISVFDTSNNTIKEILYTQGLPTFIAFSKNGDSYYVTNTPLDHVSVFKTHDPLVSPTPITVGKNPTNIAIIPSGEFGYVTNFDDNTISVINTTDNTQSTIRDGIRNGPLALAIAPNGKFIYVTNYRDRSVSVIDTSTNKVSGNPIEVDDCPNYLAITPNGKFAYVPCPGPDNNKNGTVRIIDISLPPVDRECPNLSTNKLD